MTPTKSICLGVLLLCLSGCTSIPKNPLADAQVKPAADRQVEISQFSDWKITGRISLSSPKEAIAGSLDWRQRSEDYAVELRVAFGQRTLYVEQNGNQATLRFTGRDTTSGPSGELLVLRQLGVRVPLSQLGYWLRGLPGTQGQPLYDQYGRLHTLNYQDPDGRQWRARVKSYSRINQLDLPRTIEVTDGVHAIRVVVSEWQLGEKTAVGGTPSQSEQTNPAKRINIPGETT